MTDSPQPKVAITEAYPNPPASWEPDRVITIPIPIRTKLYRLNRADASSALYFDRSGRGRFDGPDQGYGILYLGEDIHVCFAECFARSRTNAVAEAELQKRKLFEIHTNRALTLIDLTGAGLVRMGADAVLTTGDYPKSRLWVKTLWEYSESLPQPFDGIRYRSRVDNDRYCYGLFDRTQKHLSETDKGSLVEDEPVRLAEILEDYCYSLISC